MTLKKLSRCGNKACKHKFTKHSPECRVSGCPCRGFVDENGKVMIVELKSKREIELLPKAALIFKQKHPKAGYTALNHWLFWNDKAIKGWPPHGWTCIKCAQYGTWSQMREHGHYDDLVKVIKK